MSNVITFSDFSDFRNPSQVSKATGTKFFLLTPQDASTWLDMNVKNRSLAKKNWIRYAAEMKAGRWVLNGETIKFSNTGALIDGQHRLVACQNSGVTVPVEVRFGLADEMFHVIDGGKSRNWSDTLTLEGVKDSNKVASVITKVVGLLRETKTRKISHEYVPARTEMLKFYHANAAALNEATFVGGKLYKQINRACPQSVIGAMYFTFAKINPSLGPKYMSQLCTGIGSSELDPAYRVRQSLINARMTTNRAMPTTHQQALIIKGWNFFLKGKEVKKISYSPAKENSYPRINGIEVAQANTDMVGI